MKVLGLLGMPGSGKTTALKSLEDRVDHDFSGLKMKDVAAKEFNKMQENGLEYFPKEMRGTIKSNDLVDEATPDGRLGDEIANWVDFVLSINGSYFAEEAKTKIQGMTETDVVVVDGIRSVSDVENVMEAADVFRLVYLQTPFHTRLERLKDRGREGEEDIDAQYLLKRDKQEFSWGIDEILASYQKGYSDYEKEYPVEHFYANHDTVSSFEVEFNFYVDDLFDLN